MPIIQNDYWHTDGTVKCLELPFIADSLARNLSPTVPTGWYLPSFDDSGWTTPVDTGVVLGTDPLAYQFNTFTPPLGPNDVPVGLTGIWNKITTAPYYYNVMFRHWITIPLGNYTSMNFGSYVSSFQREWLDFSQNVVMQIPPEWLMYNLYVNGAQSASSDRAMGHALIPGAPNLIAFWLIVPGFHPTGDIFHPNYAVTQWDETPTWHAWRIHTISIPGSTHFPITPPVENVAAITPYTAPITVAQAANPTGPLGFMGPVEITNGTGWSNFTPGGTPFQFGGAPVPWVGNTDLVFPPTVSDLTTSGSWVYGFAPASNPTDLAGERFAQGFVARWSSISWISTYIGTPYQPLGSWVVTMTIYDELNGVPNNVLGASTLSFLMNDSLPTWYQFNFTPAVSVTPETTYFAVISFTGLPMLSDRVLLPGGSKYSVTPTQWRDNIVPQPLGIFSPVYGHDEVAAQTLVQPYLGTFTPLTLNSITPTVSPDVGPISSAYTDISDGSTHTLLSVAIPSTTNAFVVDLECQQDPSTSIGAHGSHFWVAGGISQSMFPGQQQRRVYSAHGPLTFTATVRANVGNLDKARVTVTTYTSSNLSSINVEQTWPLVVGGDGLACVAQNIVWTSPPNGMGNGGRPDPNATGWPLASCVSGWCPQPALTNTSNTYDIYQPGLAFTVKTVSFANGALISDGGTYPQATTASVTGLTLANLQVTLNNSLWSGAPNSVTALIHCQNSIGGGSYVDVSTPSIVAVSNNFNQTTIIVPPTFDRIFVELRGGGAVGVVAASLTININCQVRIGQHTYDNPYDHPMGVFQDFGYMWVIGSKTTWLGGVSYDYSWGPVQSGMDAASQTYAWPWYGISARPQAGPDGEFSSRAVRRADGTIFAFIQSDPEDVSLLYTYPPTFYFPPNQQATGHRSRVGYQVLSGNTPGSTFGPFVQLNTGEDVDYKVAGLILDASDNVHLFWYAWNTETATLPYNFNFRLSTGGSGVYRYYGGPDKLWHMAIAPDGTAGPIASFDTVLGASQYPTGTGCIHQSGGVIFPYVSYPIFGTKGCFQAAIWPNDITAIVPSGTQELPTLPPTGIHPPPTPLYSIVPQWRPRTNLTRDTFGVGTGTGMPGPGTMVRVGAQIYLFCMDGLGISVAQSDGTFWSGLAQWFSEGVHNYPYAPADGLPLRQYDMSAAYIAVRDQIGVMYTLGMDYEGTPAAVGAFTPFQPSSFFNWYDPLPAYPEFIPSGCAGGQPGIMVVPLSIGTIQGKLKNQRSVQVIG